MRFGSCCGSFSKLGDNKYVVHTNYSYLALHLPHLIMFLAIFILWESNVQQWEWDYNMAYITQIHFIYMYILQASGLPLPQLALGPLPVPIFHSLPLTTTRQCYLEGTSQEVAKSMTAILWILSQWYAQRDIVYFSYASLQHTLSM